MTDPSAHGGSRRRRSLAERRERRTAIDDVAVVMEAAAAFLAVRPRSVAETRARLRHLGYRPELIEEVVERLQALEYLDDEVFARAWVESRDRARPRGEAALRRELALKGIDPALSRSVLEERKAGGEMEGPPFTQQGARDGEALSSPDLVAAARLLERRGAALLREPDDRKRLQKAYALLARNGFDPSTCREAIASWSRASE